VTSDFLADVAKWLQQMAEAFTAVMRAISERLRPLLEQARRLLDLMSAEPPRPARRLERWPRRRAPRTVAPGRGLSTSALGRPMYRPLR
jgi:hypothetical protein